MNESNISNEQDYIVPRDLEEALRYIETLRGQVAEWQGHAETRKHLLEMASDSLERYVKTINGVTSLVQEEFDKGGWIDDDPFLIGLTEYLDLDFEEEYSVTVTAKWDVTFTAKKGYDLGNLSVDINRDPEIDGDGVSDISIGWVDVEVDEA